MEDRQYTQAFPAHIHPARDGEYMVQRISFTAVINGKAQWTRGIGWNQAGVASWRGLTELGLFLACQDALTTNAKLAERLDQEMARVSQAWGEGAKLRKDVSDKLQALQDGALFVLRKLDEMESSAPVWQKEAIDKAREEMKKRLWPSRTQ